MTGKQVYPVSPEVAKQALLNREQYEEMYRQSVEDPDTFWGEHGKRLEWIKPYTKVKNTTYDYNNLSIKWFEDGQLNASANCLDRHLEKVCVSRPLKTKNTSQWLSLLLIIHSMAIAPQSSGSQIIQTNLVSSLRLLLLILLFIYYLIFCQPLCFSPDGTNTKPILRTFSTHTTNHRQLAT